MRFGVLLLMLLLLLLSCSDQETFEQYSGSTLSIKYVGQIEEDEWIEIDGYRLIHKDIYGFLTDPVHSLKDSLELLLAINDFEKDIYLQTSKQRQYLSGANQWKELTIDNKIMAYDLFVRFITKIKATNPQILKRYEFKNDANILYGGELIMTRNDGEVINIKTSKDYAISVKVLSDF